jgi:acetyltransferase-like isoleucine patch superfamily enzyme
MMNPSAVYIAPDAQCSHISGPATAGIYKQAHVENTVLGEHASIGDFSRVFDSELADFSQLQRNNMVYHARLGRYSYTGRNTTIWYADIGAFCSISWNVSIGGANHDYTRLTTHAFLYDSKDFGLLPAGQTGYDRFSQPCTIENDVWIGAGTCICRGVTVGTGAVIAAGAVVTHDVAPYTIVAGVPARPIKKRFSDAAIQRLLASRWWELPADVIRENYALFNAAPEEENLSRLEKLREDIERSTAL